MIAIPDMMAIKEGRGDAALRNALAQARFSLQAQTLRLMKI